MPRILDFLGYCPIPSLDSLAEELRSCRARLGLSLKDMARMLKVGEGPLAEWESGKTAPAGIQAVRIESFLRRLLPG